MLYPLSFLLEPGSGKRSLKEPVQDVVSPKPKALVCANCMAMITEDRARMVQKGGHEHRFFNPHGIVFHIGCFARAPGCRPYGPTSNEFSWFPGYLWRLVCCNRCENHLGWSFSNSGPSFYALILNRLLTATSGEN